MTIETELVDLLTGDAGIGSMVAARVYPVVLPQNPTLPAIVYQEVRGVARAAADGDTGQRESRFLVSWWASSYSAIKVGKGLMLGLLSGYEGGSISRVEVDGIRDDYDPETGRFRQLVELMIYWTE